jgi:hypothetical protein
MATHHVSRGTRGTTRRVCSACQTAAARPGQRYCRPCHAQAQRQYRVRLTLKRRSEAWELSRLRLQVETAAWRDRVKESLRS